MRLFPLLTLLLLVAAAPPAVAQVPSELYEFELVVPPNIVDATGGGARVDFTVKDLSRDSTNVVPQANAPPTGLPHTITFQVGIEGDRTGWGVASVPAIVGSRGGMEHTRTLNIAVTEQVATSPFIRVNLTMVANTNMGETFRQSAEVVVMTQGVLGFNALAGSSPEPMAPRQVETMAVSVTNLRLTNIVVQGEVVSNPCGMHVLPPPSIALEPGENRPVQFEVQAPADHFWYYYENCDIRLEFYDIENPSLRRSVPYSIVVDGFYVDPMAVFWIVVCIAALLLLLLLAKRKKERLEEEIHGKPQKPWLIPVERVYLEQLKKEDPRAWYVVRHYLMEDEYRSALLWHRSYMDATKGARKKERLILTEEKSYAAWKASWQKAIAKPARKAERKVRRLTRKLERKAARRHKKAVRAHAKKAAKIEAGVRKRHERQMESWEKKARRAVKKGQPEPARPEMARPATDPAPVLQPVKLEGTRFGRKAERIRRRAVRKQGNLEVAFERADARQQAKAQRRIQKLARKLDDPDFVRDHVGQPARPE